LALAALAHEFFQPISLLPAMQAVLHLFFLFARAGRTASRRAARRSLKMANCWLWAGKISSHATAGSFSIQGGHLRCVGQHGRTG
jgi:hypothetical protein